MNISPLVKKRFAAILLNKIKDKVEEDNKKKYAVTDVKYDCTELREKLEEEGERVLLLDNGDYDVLLHASIGPISATLKELKR
tara:strand:- start:130114 stop:130362 length:249 start_codon:yes stop_codon:yes gene_type:complete